MQRTGTVDTREKDMSKQYQVVTLLLLDGRKATYTGAVQIDDKDVVEDVLVSTPIPLPQGYTWSVIEREEKRHE